MLAKHAAKTSFMLPGAKWSVEAKRKVGDESEEGPQPKRLKAVVEGGPSTQLRLEPTAWEILLEQLEMLGEVWDLAKRLKKAKEEREGKRTCEGK